MPSYVSAVFNGPNHRRAGSLGHKLKLNLPRCQSVPEDDLKQCQMSVIPEQESAIALLTFPVRPIAQKSRAAYRKMAFSKRSSTVWADASVGAWALTAGTIWHRQTALAVALFGTIRHKER